jgi:hypothetical protein
MQRRPCGLTPEQQQKLVHETVLAMAGKQATREAEVSGSTDAKPPAKVQRQRSKNKS